MDQKILYLHFISYMLKIYYGYFIEYYLKDILLIF